MKCPRCRTPDLKPTLIEEYLPAMGCETCHGSLVSLLYYRHWAETQKLAAQPPTPEAVAAGPVATSDSNSALVCPKCARVMAKYKLTGTVANRVDVCSTCDEAWLDGGEWELLEALQLSHELPAILTDAWQRRIRREQSEGTRRSILVRLIGEQGTSRVEEFREWLGRNQHKSHVLAYLYKN